MALLSANTVPIKGAELLGQQPFKKDSSLRSYFVTEKLCLNILRLNTGSCTLPDNYVLSFPLRVWAIGRAGYVNL